MARTTPVPKMSDDQVARRVLALVADAAEDGRDVQLVADAAYGMTLQRQRRALDQLAAQGACERGTGHSWWFSVRGVRVAVAG